MSLYAHARPPRIRLYVTVCTCPCTAHTATARLVVCPLTPGEIPRTHVSAVQRQHASADYCVCVTTSSGWFCVVSAEERCAVHTLLHPSSVTLILSLSSQRPPLALPIDLLLSRKSVHAVPHTVASGILLWSHSREKVQPLPSV
ncbi:unnamed protein product [Ectocarpus sp. 4 AP-2014]